MLATLWLVGISPQPSAFNAYAAFLDPREVGAACRLTDPSFLQNRTYRFRGRVYPGNHAVPLKDGRFEERFDPDHVEWSLELESQEAITLGGTRAVLARFFADHLGGSGSASHVLVMRCKGTRLEVVFEASAAGIRADYSSIQGILKLSVPVWRREDSHASPSEELHERYRWDAPSHRFVLAQRAQRKRR